MSNYSWATNTQKLRRIIDTMPNATEEELMAEYLKQGGLLTHVIPVNQIDVQGIKDVITEPMVVVINPKKESKAKKVKDAVTKAVKKVTKKK